MVSASVQLRQFTALVLAIIFLVCMPGATAHGACVERLSSQSAVGSQGDGFPPSQQDGGDQSDDDSRHGLCCKCPCHGVKILLSPAGNRLPDLDSDSTSHPPYDDPARESPVFGIFQPPKLPV